MNQRLDRVADNVSLEIKDNGRGVSLSPAAPAPPGATEQARGLGIVGMRARARNSGGELKVDSKPGEGTVISALIPFRKREEV